MTLDKKSRIILYIACGLTVSPRTASAVRVYLNMSPAGDYNKRLRREPATVGELNGGKDIR